MFSPDLYVAFYISLVHVTLFSVNKICCCSEKHDQIYCSEKLIVAHFSSKTHTTVTNISGNHSPEIGKNLYTDQVGGYRPPHTPAWAWAWPRWAFFIFVFSFFLSFLFRFSFFFSVSFFCFFLFSVFGFVYIYFSDLKFFKFYKLFKLRKCSN
jgi:hypothetical protein